MHIAAWGRDKRTNKQQVFVVLITGCRDERCREVVAPLRASWLPEVIWPRAAAGQAAGTTPSTAARVIQTGNSGPAGSWAGRKGNKYLSPAFGRKPDEAFLSQG